MALPDPIPDDPKKWDGWRKYNSEDPYERLGLTFSESPTNEIIEDHCRRLLVWWQKKLPLKNQPSNPITQMLRGGFDEAPMFLSEARAILLNPETRAAYDEQLANARTRATLEEFDRYISFAIQDRVLRTQDENRLIDKGFHMGLDQEQIQECLDAAIRRTGTVRAPDPLPQQRSRDDPLDEFRRLLRLSGLGPDDLTDDQRDTFINMAENLGIDPGVAEDLVDEFLEELEATQAPTPPPRPGPRQVISPRIPPKVSTSLPPKITGRIAPKITGRITNSTSGRVTDRTGAPLQSVPEANPEAERQRYADFVNSLGCEMLLVPTGSFLMGSNDNGAPPNEQPVTRVHISRFYLSRFPVTNLQYEQFEPTHKSRRLPSADDHHPVVHVSSSEAIRFCEWLSQKEHKRYRLPTEAEWEYAARGTQSRIFPWGTDATPHGTLANFADANTNFAWSLRTVNDGWAETSRVGAFPKGAGPFNHEDLAGNVWEWCLDFLDTYKGGERINPRGPSTGVRRVFRGGSWRAKFSSLKATTRSSNLPTYSCNDVGFRVVCECE